jgi:hypothetical protein
MNILQTILILAAAFLAVFGEAAFPLPRHCSARRWTCCRC